MQLLKHFNITSLVILATSILSACGGSGATGYKSSDTTAPIITLHGLHNVQVIQGTNYSEAGATATDDVDGDLSSDIIIAGDTVNTNADIGSTFTITYNVYDHAGNQAVEAIRTVSIVRESNQQHIIPTLSEADKANYLFLINEARAVARTCGNTGNFPTVPPVTWSNKLYQAAYEHSQDLANSNTFSHHGSGTTTDWSGYALNKQSIMRDRVATYNYRWLRISENISAGTSRDTAKKAVDSWIASPGHCHNLMDPDITEVGMAVAINANSEYRHYWTQNFGRSY